MPRYYVKNKENKWNIFSTIIDDFIYDKWVSHEDLIVNVIRETTDNKMRKLKTLLTDNPELNTMSYEEAMNFINKGGKE